MELSDASLSLTGWEVPADMQEHNCSCCDQEARLHGQEASTPILRQIDLRIRRQTYIIAFGLFSVILIMALVIAVLLGGRIQVSNNAATTAEMAPRAVSETPQQRVHPSAFLTGLASKNGTNNGRHLKWETRSGLAHCDGFGYSGGNLTVLKDGRYSINLQITLINIKGTCETNQLIMKVLNCSDGYPEFKPLLVTYDTMCCTEECIKSLSTAGVFFLEAGTILRVEAIHSRDFTRRQNEYEVFFGVHLS